MLKTVLAAPTVGNGPFTFVVPGQETWTILSLVATVQRGAGGTPNRSYLLTFTDSANAVALAPAADAGTEPGTGTITWANAPAAVLAAGSIVTVLAPLPLLVLPSGYQIVGTIERAAVADQWATALVWVEFTYS